VILIVGLAVGGVFSGSKKPATTTTAQTPTTNQTPSTQPTPPTPAATPAPATTLKPGDQGAQVKLLQRALARLGYTTGPADGDYGPSTQKALTRFQRTSAIAADGVLGPKTLAALKQALLAHG
jgi:peptidoglycan hydrolase-like protein with peptidoglycan-binding domain